MCMNNTTSTAHAVRPSDMDIRIDLGGEIVTINLLQMLVATQNAEFKAKHGVFLPGINKLRPTLAEYRRRWYIAPEWSKTWAQTAETMREMYDDFKAQYDAHVASFRQQ